LDIKDRVVVVTGAASGIGLAMCRRFVVEGAAGVVLADRDVKVHAFAAALRGGVAVVPVVGDVSSEADVQGIVATAMDRFGRIDLFCSNAGISVRGAFEAVTDAEWERIWQVNVMAHIYASRAVLPIMLAAGGGYLLQTASAAGLLTQLGAAPYAVTKHAAVAFAEWLAITYGDRGIKVSCLCPLGVRTPLLHDASAQTHALLDETLIEPEQVADAVVTGLADERFLILPHPEVAVYFGRMASDYDRWLRGMRRLQRRLGDSSASAV
jgi:NAD(P)-dependent dehydrogenase (short-subunit alcohol dehydrogenase family)